MKAIAVIVNLFLPGIGTLVVRKWGQGIAQILLAIVAVVLMLTGVGVIIGGPLLLAVWVWSIVTAASANPEPVQVVVHQSGAEG